MELQKQGWLRGAIIAAAIAAVGVFLVGRRSSAQSNAGDAADAVASTGQAALDTVGSSEIGQRVGRIAELMLGNVSDQALAQVKGVLKDAVAQLDHLVDQL